MFGRLGAILFCALLFCGATAARADEPESSGLPALLSKFESWRSPGSAPPAVAVGQAQHFGGVCHDCDLSNRRLPGVVISEGDFSRALFVRAVLVRMEASGSTFTEADFSLANLTSGVLSDATCDRARFTGALLARVSAPRSRFRGADFSNAEATDADFTQAQMAGARFAGARTMRSVFLSADLAGANFAFAQLDNADFTAANLRGATFSNASLRGANLSRALNLTRAQLAGACGDQATRLPKGIPALRRCPKTGTGTVG